MELVLVGQPYSGKSTLFNEVAGYKSVSTNAPGSSVDHVHGQIEIEGERVELVDLAGLYSLQVSDDESNPTVDHLINADEDTVFVNVIDASVLSRSLELTLQLAELRRPMVLCLNMMDEAQRKGLKIDAGALSEKFGVPVVECVGKTGEGVAELFRQAVRAHRERLVPKTIEASSHLERVIRRIGEALDRRGAPTRWHPRFVAIKLLEHDPFVRVALEPHLHADDWTEIRALRAELELARQKDSAFVVSAMRHNLAFELFEAVATIQRQTRRDVRHRIDDVLMHPVFGYVALVGILFLIFTLVFRIGNAVEPLFLEAFDDVTGALAGWLGADTLIFALADGVVSGFGGGIGIVIPYLLPFFIALALLEDSGYLPRIAYLIDGVMHRMGLHGMSVVPIVMGYGCSVPGILATRILKSRRDRLITATLTTLIPCSARMTIIFGLVGFFISMKAAILIYVINLILVGLTGWIMSRLMPESSPGLVMEIPRYHMPRLEPLISKTWFRLREFVVIAWPILIAGSVVLEVIDYFELTRPINLALEPFTVDLLGFPLAVGVTLLFGIMRKELALVLLFGAIGTSDVLSVMSGVQIFTYTFFVTFYVPCLATYAALGKELGFRAATLVSLLTLAIVSVLTAGLRFVLPLVM